MHKALLNSWQVWNLTLGMIGKQEKPIMHCKAGEARGLLGFTVELLRDHQAQLSQGKDQEQAAQNRLNTAFLLGAGESASQLEQLFSRNSKQRSLNVDQHRALVKTYYRFVVQFRRYYAVWTPKCHQMYHLLQLSQDNGSPVFYHNYASETLNGHIARIARSCHRTEWAEAIFTKLKLEKQVEGAT